MSLVWDKREEMYFFLILDLHQNEFYGTLIRACAIINAHYFNKGKWAGLTWAALLDCFMTGVQLPLRPDEGDTSKSKKKKDLQQRKAAAAVAVRDKNNSTCESFKRHIRTLYVNSWNGIRAQRSQGFSGVWTQEAAFRPTWPDYQPTAETEAGGLPTVWLIF